MTSNGIHAGWTQLAIGCMDAKNLTDLVRLAGRDVAPKRLTAQ